VAFLADAKRRDGFVPPVADNVNYDNGLVTGSFVHPWPLSDRQFLAVSGTRLVLISRPVTGDPDLVTPLLDIQGETCLEPISLRPRRRPPVIPDTVDLNQDSAIVMVHDVYQGRDWKVFREARSSLFA